MCGRDESDWACAGEPQLAARSGHPRELALERLQFEITKAVEESWARGFDVLSPEAHDDQARREHDRDHAHVEESKAAQTIEVHGDDGRPDDVAERLLRCLAANPHADRDIVRRMSGQEAWTPVTVLYAIARVRTQVGELSDEARDLIATESIVRRAAAIPEIRVRWLVLGLASLSEPHWTVIECCLGSTANSPSEVSERFQLASGISLTSKTQR